MIKKKIQKGFTLIEALVAISIIMVAVAAPITIAQKGLSSSVYAKNQMIAAYLAQDAIEYIKNRRDSATISDSNFDWSSFISEFDGTSSCMDTNWCDIDTTVSSNQIRTAGSVLKKDSDGFFGHNGADDTIFNRKVQIKENPNGINGEALVIVNVNWGGEKNELEVKTLIYNY